MTTTQAPSARTRPLLPTAVAAGAAALLLILVGTYLDTPLKSSGEWGLGTGHSLGELPLLIAFAVVGPAVVFGVVVARGLRAAPQTTVLRSLIAAAAGVVSLAVFWTGLPVVLAAGAATLGLDARARLGRLPATATAAVALAALAALAAVWLAFAG